MTDEDFKSAARLLDLLRQKGARSFKGFGIELELGPKDEQSKDSKPMVDPSLCACGHAKYNHNNGICTEDVCAPEKCNPEARA